MILKLSNNIDLTDFLTNYIPKKLFNYVLLNLNEDKLIQLDEYLNKHLGIKESSIDIIEYGFNNMFISDTGTGFIVMIDNNILIPDSSQKLINIINLINYGNLEVRGCNIVSQAFNYVESQLNNMVLLYRLKRGGA